MTTLEAGADLVDAFEPFVRHLHDTELASKTIRRHMNGLWALSDTLIRQRQMEVPPQPIPPLAVLVDEVGGPLLHGSSVEEDQRSFDVTCRALHRFFKAGARR